MKSRTSKRRAPSASRRREPYSRDRHDTQGRLSFYDRDLRRRADLLRLKSRILAERMRMGTFRSAFRGRGIEFSDVREYLIGDDVRSIDWNVTARMNKAFVKMYETERELDVLIILDASFSMTQCFTHCADAASEAAALITLSCLNNANPVGAVIFSGGINFVSPPETGRAHAFLLLSEFDKAMTSGASTNGSALDKALLCAGRVLKKRSLVFIISDFRTTSYFEHFSALSEKNDVIAIKITCPEDERLPNFGTVRFRDPETGLEAVLPTSPAPGSKGFLRYWEKENKRRNETWSKECVRRGGTPLYISTRDDVSERLIQAFSILPGGTTERPTRSAFSLQPQGDRK